MIKPIMKVISIKQPWAFLIVHSVNILYEQYFEYLKRPLPKVIFYIIMDELYRHLIVKDEEAKDLEYRLKIVV